MYIHILTVGGSELNNLWCANDTVVFTALKEELQAIVKSITYLNKAKFSKVKPKVVTTLMELDTTNLEQVVLQDIMT